MTLVAGRYQPLDARGARAALRARDLQTAQTVLLREVPLPGDAPHEALARASAAQGVFHPSLVTLFDVVSLGDDRVLLAYEFVPAQTVAQVSGGQPFNLKRAAEIVAEIADAMAELHARGILHGGISDSSVLVTLKGKAKLDRVGDPRLYTSAAASTQHDISALAALLQQLVGRPRAATPGAAAIETIVARVRQGRIESAATFAAMLRKL